MLQLLITQSKYYHAAPQHPGGPAAAAVESGSELDVMLLVFPSAQALSLICRDNNPLYEALPSPCPVALCNICYSLGPIISATPQALNAQLMNFPSRCCVCALLLHWFSGPWRDMERGHGSWLVGLASSSAILTGLMKLMSGGLCLSASSVSLCCEGYTFQHLSFQMNKNTFIPKQNRKLNAIIFSYLQTFTYNDFSNQNACFTIGNPNKVHTETLSV